MKPICFYCAFWKAGPSPGYHRRCEVKEARNLQTLSTDIYGIFEFPHTRFDDSCDEWVVNPEPTPLRSLYDGHLLVVNGENVHES